MSTSESIQELAKQVRAWTLRVLEKIDDDWYLYAPPGLCNHIAWHAGHSMWVNDDLCIQPVTGQSKLPDGWAKTYGIGEDATPPSQTTDWLPRLEMMKLLEAQLEDILEAVGSCDESKLAGPAPGLGDQWSLGGYIMHGLHDEAKHGGEMHLLRKICKAEAGLL